ncbi:Twitching motility protein PilT [hydrothermal vent metagenome]|uniref:Twitching motility protein PilT n=1 Tax=hydrothermal vent metagenome TaxID=652676 RepID=A0A3B1DP78_9ZZZZ
MNVDTLLKASIEQGASDLHVKVGATPMARINGMLTPLGQFQRMNKDDVTALAYSVLSPAQRETFKQDHEIDLAYSAAGLGRFRVSIFMQRGTVGAVFRVIPSRILSLQDLVLPEAIHKLAKEQRGLVLVTGTTGSGKSTTLAAMVDIINTSRTVNIITIEDPIEFLHRDKKGIVSQREIGQDTESFGGALRAALRQDPDVIMVGEMRDFETISTALTAAETGHLVLSTLHTLDATETINRIVSVFPPYHHDQVRMQLSTVLKGIVSMRLIPRAEGEGRVPAVEILLGTQTVCEAITDAKKTRTLKDVIAAGKTQYGMQTFDQSIYEHYQNGLISYEEALKWTSTPEDFALKVKGIQSTSDSWEDTQQEGAGAGDGETEFEIDRF